VVGVAAEVQEAGSSTVPATRLHDLLRNLPAGGQVVLEHPSREPHAKLACGRTRVSLPTLPPGDFPLMTAEGAAAGGPIAPAALARLFETTRHAISGEATRYYLCGAYLHVVEVGGERLLRVVATDGARLALAEIPAPDGFETLPPVIVPTKAVDEITKLLAGEADAELRTSAAKVVLDVGSNRLVSKVLDGSYPEYARVIPRDNPRRLRVDVGALASALKRAAVLADDKSRSIRFSISPGQLALSAPQRRQRFAARGGRGRLRRRGVRCRVQRPHGRRDAGADQRRERGAATRRPRLPDPGARPDRQPGPLRPHAAEGVSMADPLTRYRVRSFARPDDATGVVQACAGYAAAIVVASQKVALFGARARPGRGRRPRRQLSVRWRSATRRGCTDEQPADDRRPGGQDGAGTSATTTTAPAPRISPRCC
jgi:hypothetical protein